MKIINNKIKILYYTPKNKINTWNKKTKILIFINIIEINRIIINLMKIFS